MSDIAIPAQHGPMLALIDKALDKGADADQLDKITAIVQRMMAAQAQAAYQSDMNACQRAMPTILKTKAAKNSKYAALEDIVAAITPVYTAHGFALSFDTAESPLPDHMRVVCDVLHTAGHRERRHLDLPIDGVGAKGGQMAMSALQGHGSTVAYGRRYLTAMIFNLTVAGEDTDAGHAAIFVTEEQEAELGRLIDESGANLDKFLAWAQVHRLADVRADNFKTVRNELLRKLKGKGAAA